MKKPITRWLLLWLVVFALLAAIGWRWGSALIALPNLQASKFLYVIAYSCALVGLLVLSRFVADNPRYQEFVAGRFVEFCMAAFIGISSGLLLRSLHGADGPSKLIFDGFVFKMAYICLLAFGSVGQVIETISKKRRWSTEQKARLLGGSFVVGGAVLQLIAGVIDLYS